MNYKVKSDFIQTLKSDLDKKYLASGVRLGGSIKDNKISLYTTDSHGKHSNFASRTFYGRAEGGVLTGRFSVSHYALLLLGLLTGICIESIVMAIISGSYISAAFPIAIIVVEVMYFIFIKRISAENDKLIKKYLEDCTVED